MPKAPDSQHRLSSPLVEGFYAWVSVDGEPLAVTSVRKEGFKTVCTIQAPPGESFEVHHADLRVKPPQNAYMSSTYVDGQDAESLLTSTNDICFSRPVTDESRFAVSEGTHLTSNSLRPFRFPTLPSSSSPSSRTRAASSSRAAVTGTIQVRYWRIKKIKTSQSIWSPDADKKAQAKALPPEEMIPAKTRKGASFSYIDPEHKPLFILEFRYSLQNSPVKANAPAKPSAKAPSNCKVVVRPAKQPPPAATPTAAQKPPAPAPARSPSPAPAKRRATPSPAVSPPAAAPASASAASTSAGEKGEPDFARRLSKLKRELDVLKRKERIAELESQIEEIEEAMRVKDEKEEGRKRKRARV
ncbi:hypothetical protein JCM10207_007476 [Rhodosporidiobolus poonsookiae]